MRVRTLRGGVEDDHAVELELVAGRHDELVHDELLWSDV